MRKFLTTILALSTLFGATAQPKMVINIVVGGLSATDIDRYSANLSAEGIMRLKRGGTFFTECYTDFVPTSEQVSLATIATGALPSMHGISSTRWYDRTSGNSVVRLCQTNRGDYTVEHFVAPTLSQTIIANSSGQSITIAHKPTSAMILAGKSSECYWIDSLGNWSSAACYAKSLPEWVNSHNEIGYNRIQVSGSWFGKLTKGKYINSRATDIKIYDIYAKSRNNSNPRKVTEDWLDEFMTTPAGNNALFDFATKALDQMVNNKEQNGTKLLNICLDIPRNIAEKYGTDSVEYEDMLYRLDGAIENFLKVIDICYPKQQDYLIVLTSDHGMGRNNPSSEQSSFNTRQAEVILNAFLSAQYGQGSWVLSCQDGAIYLNRDLVYSKKLSIAQVQNEAATFALQFRGMANAATATALQGGAMSNQNLRLMQNGYYPRRSGDILYCLQPHYSEYDAEKVAQSGSPYNYDRHIPLIFYGAGCKNGKIDRKVSTTAIAVTTATLLGISKPDCADGEVIYELINR